MVWEGSSSSTRPSGHSYTRFLTGRSPMLGEVRVVGISLVFRRSTVIWEKRPYEAPYGAKSVILMKLGARVTTRPRGPKWWWSMPTPEYQRAR